MKKCDYPEYKSSEPLNVVDEPILLVNEFNPTTITHSPAKVNRESEHYINISFSIQNYDGNWYKCSYNISKKSLVRI